MNCFEARKGFSSYWRRGLTPQDQAVLAAHLKECARCERSFRIFALTAPVLHSEKAPEGRTGPEAISLPPARLVASRRGPSLSRGRAAMGVARPWRMACAALAMLAVASFSAYMAAAAPHQTIDETLTGDEPALEPAADPTDAVIIGADLIDQDQQRLDTLLQESARADINHVAG